MDGSLGEWERAETAMETVGFWPAAQTADDWERLKANAVARAGDARAAAVRGALIGMARGGRWLAAGLFTAVRSLLAAIGRYREERRTLAALHALDDRTLKDIGLSRGDLQSIAWHRPASRTPVA